MDNALINYLRPLLPLTELSEKVITSSFEWRTAKEGDCLFRGGRICTEMFFISKGVLKIAVINEAGNDLTHFFLKENQFCTILHSFNNEVNASESIIAACNAEVLAITKPKLQNLYQQLPAIKELIDQITQQRLLDKIQIRNKYLGKDSTERYKLFVAQHPEIASRVPLRDIASYLNITPQSLSRIRKNKN